ncbi:SMC-Scp complex subunit ScpB [Candidatus Endobugula sertula]|uniref:SMC-Scp complex subunit ScpB n=1 Tax=Candidatus Endobugula sertula TaxID=62101 RepID=A0A1D2QMY4_9GAMM|nr:SMC-Scp complex subunit ScpB [Candidatus Endobugula sertula]
MEKQQLRNIIEGALLAYGQPLSIEKLHSLFVLESTETYAGGKVQIEKKEIIEALEELQLACEGCGYELKEVASGWRFQVREEIAPWVNKLWEEKPQRYSRALMETLAIIAYRQPITRGDIEEIRGVAVSSTIIRTLSEREWIRVIGQRDVPGRPSLYATTKPFLDYFNLQSLDELPSLKELTDIESLTPELELEAVTSEQSEGGQVASSEVDAEIYTEGSNDENITGEGTG